MGTQSSNIMHSPLETSKTNDIELFFYLLLVLRPLPYWGRYPSNEKLETPIWGHPNVKFFHREEQNNRRYQCQEPILGPSVTFAGGVVN